MTGASTTREDVEVDCELLRLLAMGLQIQFPKDPRFLGMFDRHIATLRALLDERDAARAEVERMREALQKIASQPMASDTEVLHYANGHDDARLFAADIARAALAGVPRHE
jgi:hypothetical protein